MNFDIYMPVRLITGRGCVRGNADAFAKLGGKCMIVTSGGAAKKRGALDDVTAALESRGVAWTLYDKVRQNPLLADSHEAGELARRFGAEFIVGIGGGSPLDAAKAVAVYAANEIELLDIYNTDWPRDPLPLVLVGTTAGTGSEVGPFSVMTRPDGRKVSVASDKLYARIAFGDPGYTDSLPLRFTVSTALDALSHALEAYFSTTCSALSDLFAAQAVRTLVPALTLLQTVSDASDIPAETRDALYYASVLAGFSLAKCGTCYCHSLGYFLTEGHGMPHGFACAATLPDFTRRAGRLMDEKAAALYADAGCTEQQLCGLIEALAEPPQVTLSAAEIDEILDRYDGSKNYAHTGPDGYTRAEALEMMTRLYGV